MAAHQAPLSLGFSRQEYWSRLPFPSPMHESKKWKWSSSVVSDSSRPHGLQTTRLLHPWDFAGRVLEWVTFPIWEDQASGLSEFGSFTCTAAIWGRRCFPVHLVSCIPQLLCSYPGGWQHQLAHSFGSLHSHIHIWRPDIADGCHISCLLIWQEIFSFHNII